MRLRDLRAHTARSCRERAHRQLGDRRVRATLSTSADSSTRPNFSPRSTIGSTASAGTRDGEEESQQEPVARRSPRPRSTAGRRADRSAAPRRRADRTSSSHAARRPMRIPQWSSDAGMKTNSGDTNISAVSERVAGHAAGLLPERAHRHRHRLVLLQRRLDHRSYQSVANGSMAAMRARLIAFCSLRWCSAHVPEMRRGRIFPRSGMNCCSVLMSL